ncbi:mobile element protein [Geomicrobium sp. JCM 19037]|uniref:IS3 family transposase n=1 Tax=Geomicrobium sp. JCM 19037 TaxID=1460634 RepID=UPI00045F317F|nr:IS3 family transposase [Geomicrobium sp. JCM 19037]GAK06307.1 mobile element protein [Geomicrobium sp. JCM 19037]
MSCQKFVRKSRYRSYKGKVGKVSKNRINRRFRSTIRLQKLFTDVTEFKCTEDEKLYLSPILDVFNGEVIAYHMAKRPTLDFVLQPLQEAVQIIGQEGQYRATIHSDQGWHYQHKSWVKTLKNNQIFQSMSRKATCEDNSPMENFFGLLKQEMYYGEPMLSYDELEKRIHEYMHYYNHDRIKLKLAGHSPVQYRTLTSQSAS